MGREERYLPREAASGQAGGVSALLPPNSGRCARSTAQRLRPTAPLAAATPKRPPSRSGRSEATAQAPARHGSPGKGGAGSAGRPLGRGAEGAGPGAGPGPPPPPPAGLPRTEARLGPWLGPWFLTRGPVARQEQRTAVGEAGRRPPWPEGDLPGLGDAAGKTKGPGERPDRKGELFFGEDAYVFYDKHILFFQVF